MDLDSGKIRRPSKGFGWIDNRIVSKGYLAQMGQAEVPVYLVLCVVADRHGISYYHPATLARFVKHPCDQVRRALESLVARGLIAVRDRFVQVCDLEEILSAPTPAVVKPVSSSASCHPADNPDVEPAGVALLRVPEDVRQDALRRALERMRSFLGQSDPRPSVLQAVAASMLREEGKL